MPVSAPPLPLRISESDLKALLGLGREVTFAGSAMQWPTSGPHLVIYVEHGGAPERADEMTVRRGADGTLRTRWYRGGHEIDPKPEAR